MYYDWSRCIMIEIYKQFHCYEMARKNEKEKRKEMKIFVEENIKHRDC